MTTRSVPPRALAGSFFSGHRWAVSLLFLCLAAWIRAQGQTTYNVHDYIQSYEGSRTCTECHPEKPAEVARSLHYQHQAAALNVAGFESNSMGMATSYCGLPATITSINWIGLLQPTNTSLPAQPGGCARCHAGNGAKPNVIGNLTQADYDSVDCLVCHAPGYVRTVVNQAGTLVLGAAPGVDTTALAKQVQRPTSDMCLRCHMGSGGGPNFKHGVVPTPSTDVHLAAGLSCVDCHFSSAHHTAGSGDLKAVDLPGARVDCANCHTATPHTGASVSYNSHTARVACQTCHIPLIARSPSVPTVLERDWTQPVFNPKTGLFDPKNVMATNVVPVYRWWNGKLQKYPPGPLGSLADATARIYPWKHITAYVPADAATGVLLPLKAGVYSIKGNLTQSVAAGAQQSGTPYSGNWVKVADDLTFGVSHQVAPKAQALHCADCHAAQGGRLDFAALGYSSNQVAFLQSPAPLINHAGRFGTNYAGAASCVSCHPGKADEVMGSVHYTWRTTNSNLAFPGGGSHGMLDRFCGLVGASAMVNYYADLGGHKGSSACGKCHIAQTPPFPDPATGQYTQTQKDGLDCLICHAGDNKYDMNGDGVYDEKDAEASARSLEVGADGRRVWHQDRSLLAAESVGPKVSTAACLRCHEHGMAAPDYKRGTPYNAQHDVHAAAGLLCTDCHKVDHHKMARGSRVTDMHAWELQTVEVDCANCHGTKPHGPALAPYNDHTGLIACETCHIPRTSGASRRVWGSTFGITNGPEALVPRFDPTNGVFEPYTEYNNAPYAQRPAYRWFNGSVSMLAEPMNDASAWDSRIATKATPGAKIYPLRPIVNGMVLDGRGFGYNPQFSPQFTMAAAMDAMQGPMKMMGFMRPSGLNDRERAVLAQYPNLLAFDEEEYVHSGNVRESVSIGLGRLALLMSGQDGYAAPVSMLSSIGSNLWSGEAIGLDMPNNPTDPTFNPTADPTQVTGAFISLSHAVVRTGALTCVDCHSQASVLDFKTLSYAPAEASRLQGLFDSVQFLDVRPGAKTLQLRWSAIPGRTYQLMSAPDLTSANWVPIGTASTATAVWQEYTVPDSVLTNSAQLFFRVKASQP